MINVAIIDGAIGEAATTKKIIEIYAQERNISVKITIYGEGMNFISDYVPVYDLIILDVDLPHVDGITVAKKLRQIDASVGVMFVTNKAQYAIHGYEVDAIDYVLKPLEYANFARKLNRVFSRIKDRGSKKVKVFTDGQQRCFSAGDICYIEVTGHILKYHLKDEVIICRGRLSEVEQVLEGEPFARIYKSFIINLAYVEKVAQKTVMVNGEELLLSRSKKKEFINKLDEYLAKYAVSQSNKTAKK